jgi:8-oxo-dGTP pyrophosphatase MutT (NUDIX family)
MFITFNLVQQFLKTYQRQEIEGGELIPAGVLILLFERQGELSVVLTRRTHEVEHHKGQVSLPGGVMDATDTTIIETALRETEEEVGLSRTSIEVIGVLNDFLTPSGFRITPVVAFLPFVPSFSINRAEVTEVFDVPLSFFLDLRNERVEQLERYGTMIDMYFYRYGNYEIWGATAAMIRSFLHAFSEWAKHKKAL